ncbi:peptidoglycan-binding protein, partial [Patescibacteria group bacterium]|nr:peptidoglycan-binding protein [Patescibacteria group bacterium]
MKKITAFSTVIAIAWATAAGAQTYQFAANLRVGSTGAEVIALQTWLISNGYDIPAIESGAAKKGMFGSQTKAALEEYQKAEKLPSTGFFGPLTRASLMDSQSSASAASTASASGQAVQSSASSQVARLQSFGITTIGTPGIMTVTQGPISDSIMHAGDSMVPVLNTRVEAQYSDVAVSGIVVDLGTDPAAYEKIFSKIYVVENGKVLASVPLNTSTVVPVGSQWVVEPLFVDTVSKGTYKDFVIKADLYPEIDSKYVNEAWTLSVDQNALAGVDGAGVILYGPATNGSVFHSMTLDSSLVDNAQANVSLDPASPLVSAVPVTDTTNNQYLGLPVLTFDVNAQND